MTPEDEHSGGGPQFTAPLQGWTMADLVLLVVTVTLCVWVIWESVAVHGLTARFGPGPGLFPAAVAGSALVLMVFFVLQGPSRAERGSWPDATGIRRILVTLAATCLVPIVAPTIGLFTAAVLLTAFVLLVVLRAKLLPSLLTLAVVGSIAYLLFFVVLNSPMPRGPVGVLGPVDLTYHVSAWT
jgi:hypothetical protein